MKRTLLSLLITNLISFSGLSQQFDNGKYDREYFLIGMLNEDGGYQRTFHGNNYWYQKVDFTTTQGELKYLLLIDSLFRSDYPDITIKNNGSVFRIYSPILSKKIDDYFVYEPATGGNIVYDGRLKKEKFETEKQKLSYLLGACMRYGRSITDGIRTNAILMSNAPAKASFCAELLTDLECGGVEYFDRNAIFLTRNNVYFAPSGKMQEVVNEAERLNRQIETLYTNQVNFTTGGTKYIWDGSGDQSRILFRYEPFYLVDGLEVSKDDMASLQTDDVESISIFKDAGTCFAMFGTRGANGAISVITKKDNKAASESNPDIDFIKKGDFFPDMKIYPNPFSETLCLTGAEGSTLRVVTENGNVVHTQKLTSLDETIRIEHLSNGVYFFQVDNEKQTKIVRGMKGD